MRALGQCVTPGSSVTPPALSAGDAGGAPATHPSLDAVRQVVKEFAGLYIAAVRSGDVLWASAKDVTELLADGVRFTAPDGQRFVGKPAVVRRLNKGVEQFVKMVGQQAGGGRDNAGQSGAVGHGPSAGAGDAAEGSADAPSSDAAAAVAHVSSKLHVDFQVRVVGGEGSDGTGSPGSGVPRTCAKLCGWFKRVLHCRACSRKGHRSACRGGAKAATAAAQPSGPPLLLVEYKFRYGLRRLMITDRVRVGADGRISSMRRGMKL